MTECIHYWWTWKLSYHLGTPLAVRGSHCCQVGQNSSDFKVQPHRCCEVSSREGRCLVLAFSSAVLFLWYPSLHPGVLLLTCCLLTGVSAVFLTPFSWSVRYHSSYSAAVIPRRQPCPPLGTAPCHAHAKNSLTPSPGAEQYSCPSDLRPKPLLSIHIPLTSTQPLFLPSFNLAQVTV